VQHISLFFDSLYYLLFPISQTKQNKKWANYQIVRSVPWSIGVDFPSIFRGFLSSMEVISFTIFTVGCLPYYFEFTIILYSSIPLVIGLINFAFYFIRVNAYRRRQKHMKKHMKEEEIPYVVLQQIRGEHLSYFLFACFVLFPIITRNQLQALVCIDIHHESYVRLDTLISCSSKRFKVFSILDITLCFLYMSLPLFAGLLLHSYRRYLNPITNDRCGESCLFVVTIHNVLLIVFDISHNRYA
jgi:hypothetical protein